jgi:hypothetical protein
MKVSNPKHIREQRMKNEKKKKRKRGTQYPKNRETTGTV